MIYQCCQMTFNLKVSKDRGGETATHHNPQHSKCVIARSHHCSLIKWPRYRMTNA